MSTIFAAVIGHNDTGTMKGHEQVMMRALGGHTSARKELKFALTHLATDGLPVTQQITTPHVQSMASVMTRYDIKNAHQLLGVAYSPSTIPGGYDKPLFRSDDNDWLIAVDGAIPTPREGVALANYIASNGWNGIPELPGQYAIVALNRNRPDRLWWACKAKPLYGLFDALARGIRVVSHKEMLAELYHPVRNPQPFVLGPYASGTLTVDGQLSYTEFDSKETRGTLVLCGGGVDSLVAAWAVQATRYRPEDATLLYVDYGAKAAEAEWRETQLIAHEMLREFGGAQFASVRIPFDFYRRWANSSSLTELSLQVSKEPIRGVASEWVPARNTVLAALGIAFAEAHGFARIVTGINADAASAYPDNDLEWHQRMTAVLPYALGTDHALEFISPLVDMTKAEIIAYGKVFGIPWKRVSGWSCYEGGERQCGQCSSCRFRRAAFIAARVPDPTQYEEAMIA